MLPSQVTMTETLEEEVKRLREEALQSALTRLDEKIDELALATGKEVGAIKAEVKIVAGLVEEFKTLQKMGQGVVSVWRVTIAVAGVILVALNIWHLVNR